MEGQEDIPDKASPCYNSLVKSLPAGLFPYLQHLLSWLPRPIGPQGIAKSVTLFPKSLPPMWSYEHSEIKDCAFISSPFPSLPFEQKKKERKRKEERERERREGEKQEGRKKSVIFVGSLLFVRLERVTECLMCAECILRVFYN